MRSRRRRRYTISITMTMTSWSLELVSGVLALVNQLIFGRDDGLEIETQVLVAIHVFIYFIVIPGSYLLNTDVFKDRIVEKGWSNIIPRNKRNRRVAPLIKEDTGVQSNQRNNNSNNNAEVPTISGNVNIDTSYKVY